MFGILLKKQLMELGVWLFQDTKKGVRRSRSGVILLALLYIALFGFVAIAFGAFSVALCFPMHEAGYGWLYFALICAVSFVMGLFGCVANTYSTLFLAKDNELLFSMPIPAQTILSVRLLGVWIVGLFYSGMVYIPGFIVGLVVNRFSVSAFVCGILLFLALSMAVLAVSCILNRIMAQITKKLKNRGIVMAILSVLFIGVYYYVYFQAQTFIQLLIDNASLIGETVKKYFYAAYIIGNSGTGDFYATGIVIATGSLIAFATLLIMNRSYVKIATMSNATKRRKYTENSMTVSSVGGALLRKEFKKLTSSSLYLLNCCLGTLFLPAVGIMFIVKSKDILEILSIGMGLKDAIAVIVCGVMCLVLTMNDTCAASVSLEGKNIWILKSMPLSAMDIMKAKMKLQFLITEIPLLICALCVVIASKPNDAWGFIMPFVLPTLFSIAYAVIGMIFGVRFPIMEWKNETVPIKQGIGVLLTMLIGWAMALIPTLIYFLISKIVPSWIYLCIWCAVMLTVTVLGSAWLKKKGTKLFLAL